MKNYFSKILLHKEYGWTYLKINNSEIWYKGYLVGQNIIKEIEIISDLLVRNNEAEITRMLKGFHGQFSVVISYGAKLLAIVDRIRSYPIIVRYTSDGLYLGPNIYELTAGVGLTDESIDENAVMAFSMAGYTIGDSTLYRCIKQIMPGSYIFFNMENNQIRHVEYYKYSPWNIKHASFETEMNRLEELTLNNLESMAKILKGRQIVVPLSAGTDSRLIATGLKKIGATNVICISYGLKSNFERKISKAVAKKVGFKWLYVNYSNPLLRKTFNSELFKNYLKYSDIGLNTPFSQDMTAINLLMKKGQIDKDAVVVNGNTGDYLSGGHIPQKLSESIYHIDSQEERMEILLDAIISKHFSLWYSLKTAERLNTVKSLLIDELVKASPPDIEPDNVHGYFEYSEFMNRQVKYVLGGQRTYEYLGLDWRSPLWDDDYLNYWEHIPLEFKLNQRLYKEMLSRKNWCSAWDSIPINDYHIRPLWIKYIRSLTKLLFIIPGKELWHKFDKNIFSYHLDNFCNYAMVTYKDVAFDRRGQRHPISWHTEEYLKSKNIDYAGNLF